MLETPIDQGFVPQDPQPLPAMPQGPATAPVLTPAAELDRMDAAMNAAEANHQRRGYQQLQDPDRALVEMIRGMRGRDETIEADARAIAREFGADENTAFENVQVLRELAAERAFLDRQLATRQPVLHSWLSQQQWAAVAKDDVDNLIEHDNVFSRWGRSIRAGYRQDVLDRIGIAAAQNPDGMPTTAQSLQAERLRDEIHRAGEASPYVGPFMSLLGQLGASVPLVAGSALTVGKVTTGLTGNPLIGATASTIAGGVALFGQSSYNAFGRQYLKLVESGVPPDEAFDNSLVFAGIEGALETFGGAIGTKVARSVIRDKALAKIGKVLDVPTMQAARSSFGWGWAKAVGGELGVELTESINERFATNWAWANLTPEKRAENEAARGPVEDELLAVFRDTLLGMLPLGAVGPALKLHHDAKRAKTATLVRANWDDLAKAKEGSKIAARPGVYPAHLKAQIEANGLPETTRIDARGLRGLLQREDAAEVAETAKATGADPEIVQPVLGEGPVSKRWKDAFPEQFAQLEEEAERGGDIEVPTHEYGDKIVGTDLHAGIIDHIRLAGELTTAQLRDIQKKRPELLRRARAAIDAEVETRAEWQKQHDTIVSELADEIEATGVKRQDADAANVQATLIGAMVVVRARADGMMPKDWWAQHRPKIVSAKHSSPEELAALGAVSSPLSQVFDENDPQTGQPWSTIDAVWRHFNDDRSTGDDFSAAAAREVAVEMFGEDAVDRLDNAAIGEIGFEDALRFDSPERAQEFARKIQARAEVSRADENGDIEALQQLDEDQVRAGTPLDADAPTEEESEPPLVDSEPKVDPKKLNREVEGFRAASKDLLPKELNGLTKRQAQLLVETLREIPSPDEMAAVAFSGRAKRGWYRQSTNALAYVFGEDAPRFAALLAALSPQTSVQTNLWNALRVWGNWVKAGRPTDPKAILRIMGKSVQGTGTEKSVLGAWRNNAYRALTAKDPRAAVLSGPKVDSFRLDLIGQYDEVTNDAWMSNYSGVPQERFGGVAGDLPGKGGGYLAMSVATRRAGRKMEWQGAEVQETVWSWAKTLLEMAEREGKAAVDILTSGGLTHEAINDTPSFDSLLLQEPYRGLVVAAGYEARLPGLEQMSATNAKQDLSEPVYSKDPKAQQHLKRAARRLDDLIAYRKFQSSRAEIMVSLTSATSAIVGLDRLTKAANDGDASAATLIREITSDALGAMVEKLETVTLEQDPVSGLYAGSMEPSVGVRVSFLERERADVLAVLERFATNFNQEEVHVRSNTTGKVGKQFADGSYNTMVVAFETPVPLTRAEVEAVAASSGLLGFSAYDDRIETYFVGDPADAAAIADFKRRTDLARAALGNRSSGYRLDVSRLWAYARGSQAGRIDFATIRGKVRFPKTDRAVRTAARVATRIARREVAGSAPQSKLTDAQRTTQAAIAEAYEAMQDNNLDDPSVRRAYEELATEVLEQFDSLPIRVEVWDPDIEEARAVAAGKKPKKGKKKKNEEPYPGPDMSQAMRRDVLQNNHLYVFGTTPETFGPEGVVYDRHPLLQPANRTDVNGRPLLFNDLLRAVHDYYAHTIQPSGFGPLGEEAAWRTHMEMTRSPWARWALTSETRGQNSWVNFRAEVQGLPLGKRGFARQKVDLLPLQYVAIGEPAIDNSLSQLPGSEVLNLNALQQVDTDSLQSGSRGTYYTKLKTVLLNKSANLSTLTHEMLHWYADTLLQTGRASEGPTQTRADALAMLNALGIADFDAWDALTPAEREEAHERLAAWWERYLAEGKAPSLDMRSVFARFKTWMKRVYVDVVLRIDARYRQQFGKDLPGLPDEARQFFDRILANEGEIAEMEAVRQVVPIYQSKEESGMSDAEWEDYEAKIAAARQDSQEELDLESVQNMQWLSGARSRELRKLQQQHEAARKRIRDVVEADMQSKPIYRLVQWLKTGKLPIGPLQSTTHRINMDMAQALVFPSDWKLLKEKYGVGTGGAFGREGAIDPEAAANRFGFQSPREMLKALLRADPLDVAINRETDRRMIAEHSDLADPQRREEVVSRALHNQMRGRVLAAEVRALEAGLRKQVGAVADSAGEKMTAAEQEVARLEEAIEAGRKTANALAKADDQRPERSALLVEREGLRGEIAVARKRGDDAKLEALEAEREAVNAKLAALRSPERATLEVEMEKAREDLARMRRIAAGVPETDELMLAAAETAAMELVDATPWNQLRILMSRADRGMLQAARRAEQAVGDADLNEALQAKQRQLQLHAIRRAAQEAIREQEKALEQSRKFFGPTDKLAKRRRIELVEAGRAILADYRLAPQSQARNAALDYVKRYFPARYDEVQELLQFAKENGGNYRLMTVAQLRDMLQTVRSLWDESRREKVVEIGERKEALADVRAGLLQDLAGRDKTKVDVMNSATTRWQKTVRGISYLKAAWRRVEHWAQAAGKTWERSLVRPIIEGAQRARARAIEMQRRYISALVAIEKTLPHGTIESKELGYVFGKANGRGMVEVLGALLHTGNQSNYSKLLRGYGWGEIDEEGNLDDTRFREFLADLWNDGILKREHLEFVQSTWDLLGELLPDSQRAHRRVFGYFMAEVKHEPFNGPWGDILRGGYVPAKTDRSKVDPRQQRFEKIDQLMADERNSMPAPRSSFRHQRNEGYAKPLNLSLRMVARHIGEAVRFAELAPMIQDAMSLLNDPDVESLLGRIDAQAKESMLMPWLQAVANDSVEQPGRVAPGVDTFFRAFRARTGIAALAAGLSNSLQQVTGFFPAAVKVPPMRMLGALATWVANPWAMHRDIRAESEYFTLRSSDAGRKMRTRLHEIDDGTGRISKANSRVTEHAYFLQQAMQWLMEPIIWRGAYNDFMGKAGVGREAEEVHRAAVAHADSVLRTTQFPTDAESTAAIERGSPAWRALFQFTSYFNGLGNLNATALGNLIRESGWRSVARPKLYLTWFLGMAAPLFAAEWIAREMAGRDDDEDDDGQTVDDLAQLFGMSQLRGGAAMLTGLAPVIRTVINAGNDETWDDRLVVSPTIQMMERLLTRSPKAVGALFDEQPMKGSEIRDLYTLLAMLSGWPIMPIGKAHAYERDVEMGRARPTSTLDELRGIVTGQPGDSR